MDEEWIVRVGRKARLCLLRGDRPGLAAMTGQAGTSIAPEGLALEQVHTRMPVTDTAFGLFALCLR